MSSYLNDKLLDCLSFQIVMTERIKYKILHIKYGNALMLLLRNSQLYDSFHFLHDFMKLNVFRISSSLLTFHFKCESLTLKSQ